MKHLNGALKITHKYTHFFATCRAISISGGFEAVGVTTTEFSYMTREGAEIAHIFPRIEWYPCPRREWIPQTSGSSLATPLRPE
jgi:hypothetical protein